MDRETILNNNKNLYSTEKKKKNQGLPTLYKLEDKLTLRIMNMVSDKVG